MARTSTLLLACAVVLALAVGCGGEGTVTGPDQSPIITQVEPASGGTGGGTVIVIRGTHLSNPRSGSYQVLVGGQPATEITVVNDTEVECRTPPGAAGSADVEVYTIEGDGMAPSAYRYYPPPTLDLLTPITPAAGTRDGGAFVTVKGTGFTANDPGVTLCLIGLKVLDELMVVDDATITGYSPTSVVEIPRDVTVTNRNGTATATSGWRYFGPRPLIHSLTPTIGSRDGGEEVIITGEEFTEAGGTLEVRFGNANAFVEWPPIDEQHVRCLTPVSPVGGWVDVTVTNNNGSDTLPAPLSPDPGAFYFIPKPVLISIQDSMGNTDGPFTGGTDVTITGEDFDVPGAGVTTVTLGGVPLDGMSIDSNTVITGTTPGGPLGLVDLRITNDHGTSVLTEAWEYTFDDPAYWDPVYGPPLPTGDDPHPSQSFGFSFPFFGTNYTSAFMGGNGDIQFGGLSTTNWGGNLLAWPQIMWMCDDLYTGNNGSTWHAKPGTDRFILTADLVPWFVSDPQIKCQVHLLSNGIICILWDGATTFWPGEFGRVGVNPGGGTTVNNNSLSNGYVGGTATEAVNYRYSSADWDLSGSHVVFLPNSDGGYDCLWFAGIPAAP